MAFTPNVGDYEFSRSDFFMVDPRALVIEWGRNRYRNGVEPPVDDELKQLGRDMMPRKGAGDGEEGTSGQLQPIMVRPLPDRRLEVVGGFRRTRAALWLIESGECPDFRLKCIVTRMSDAEADLANIAENLLRRDESPVNVAHAIRGLMEDRGLTLAVIAGRFKMPVSSIHNLLALTTLDRTIQDAVQNNEIKPSAAVEISKIPGGSRKQVETFNELKESGKKVTALEVKKKRREILEANGEGSFTTKPDAPKLPKIRRTLAEVKAEFQVLSGASSGGEFARAFLGWIDGEVDDKAWGKVWLKAFPKEK